MRLIKFLFGFIITIAILAFCAVGVVFYLITDNDYSEPDYLKDSNAVEFNIEEILSYGLVDTETSNKIKFSMSEKEINLVLKKATEKLNESFVENATIRSIYINKGEGTKLTFVGYLQASSLSTSLKATLAYELINNELVFDLTEIKIGKIGVTTSLITSIIPSEKINNKVNEALLESGMKFDINSNSAKLSISLNSLKDMLLEELKDSSDYELYHTLISLMLRVDGILDETSDDGRVGFDINVSNLSFDETKDLSVPYSINFLDAKNKVERLLNEGVIEVADASLVSTFLVKGYNKLDDASKDKIKDKDFSSIGITSNILYQGDPVFSSSNKSSVIDIFISQITLPFGGLKLTEGNWNDILLQNDLVGQVFAFVRKEEDSYKVSYVAIESCYVDTKDDSFELYLTVSLNGKSIVINFDVDSPEANGLRVDGTIESVRIGSITLNDEEVKALLTYLSVAISEKWIIIDPNMLEIDIDFTGIFTTNDTLRDFVALISGIKTKFVCSSEGDYIFIH